jgi:hypothetical protein
MTKQRRFTKNIKRTSNLNYIILVGLVVLFVVYRSYFKTETIGSDFRYFLIVFLIPTVLGILILGIMKKEFLKTIFKESRGSLLKGFLIFLYVVQGFLFSYLSVGLLANVIWDNLNKKTADLNSIEIIDCKIKKINSGTSKTSPNIYFLFNDKSERISIDHETYGKYYGSKLTDLKLQISVRKGIWSYYVLDEWKIINNR